jgi:hypothetical protein
MIARWHAVRNVRGQSLIEFSLILPMVLVITFGVVEAGYALLDQHVVTKLTREGSNLISRDVTLQDAVTALQGMMTAPVNLDDGSSRVILSVIKRGSTTATTNYDKDILYQRYVYGSLDEASKLETAGPVTFGPAPHYIAPDSDNDANLQIVDLPGNIVLVPGALLYVTEIYTSHDLITPLDRFGITFPGTLYSIALF